MSDNKKRTDFQNRFIAGFTGKSLAIKKPKGQDQSKAARDERRRKREKLRREGK